MNEEEQIRCRHCDAPEDKFFASRYPSSSPECRQQSGAGALRITPYPRNPGLWQASRLTRSKVVNRPQSSTVFRLSAVVMWPVNCHYRSWQKPVPVLQAISTPLTVSICGFPPSRSRIVRAEVASLPPRPGEPATSPGDRDAGVPSRRQDRRRRLSFVPWGGISFVRQRLLGPRPIGVFAFPVGLSRHVMADAGPVRSRDPRTVDPLRP